MRGQLGYGGSVSTFQEVEARAATLGVDLSQGLSPEGVLEQRKAHGENRMEPPKRKPVLRIFLDSLKDKTLIILSLAAALSVGVEWFQVLLHPEHVPHYIDGIAILCAVLVASGVTTLNEARAAKAFEMLSRIREDVNVKVLRSGQVGLVSIHDLVVGDVVSFDPGDRLPADGLLISGVDVGIDQSTLTGESVPVRKGAEDLEMMGGAAVSRGSGRMLVTAVGAASELGKLQASLTVAEEGQTPLQERLAKLADRIGILGLSASILTFLALVGSALLRGQMALDLSYETLSMVLRFAVVAVAIIVLAVPEGLPLAVTISLAYSVRKMAQENNLVRHLASCETMGAATVICSDKTGTLTRNQMRVVKMWAEGQMTSGAPEMSDLSESAQKALVEGVSINATAYLERRENGELGYVGNPTESALLMMVAGWNQPWKELREGAEIHHQVGFTSDRKRMSTLIASPGGAKLLIKGAPEVILDRCDRFYQDNQEKPLDAETKAQILEAIEGFAGEGHRTLAVAVRALPESAATLASAEALTSLEEDLCWVAVLAIADPVRPEVRGAIEVCREAGVGVKMVTGDNRKTAESIARQIDLLGPGSLVMEGPEFRAMSDADLRPKLADLAVLARSVPSDKHRLVSLLKTQGEVVAVTGDGTNDAPALHVADVGFAMGQTGTEVAKEASDIVLLDDNFASIVSAIRWGRGIFQNIRKFLQFQLTVNVVALSTAILAAIFGYGMPLNTIQLLWVNLIMDTLAALALATEPPTPQLLAHKPHGRHAPLITRGMAASIVSIGLFMVALLMGLLASPWLPEGTTELQHMTLVFNAFVMMQVFNEVNARSTRSDEPVFRGLFNNPLFLGVIAVTVVGQLLIVEFGGEVFRTTPLTLTHWLISLGFGLVVLGFGGLIRAMNARWLAED